MTDNNTPPPAPAYLTPDQINSLENQSFWPNPDYMSGPDGSPPKVQEVTSVPPRPEALHLVGKMTGPNREPLYIDVPHAMLAINIDEVTKETKGANIQCIPDVATGDIMTAKAVHPQLTILHELAKILASEEVDEVVNGTRVLDDLMDYLGLGIEVWTESNILIALKEAL